jgi:ribonucleoside-triphosphate reductase
MFKLEDFELIPLKGVEYLVEEDTYDIEVKDIHCFNAKSESGLESVSHNSASICLFSKEDNKMMSAKTYPNYNPQGGVNKQRARSNNSVVLIREETTKEEFDKIFSCIKDFGEPGFYFVNDLDQGTNPCCEINLYPQTKDGLSGWEGCNLSSANGSKLTSREKLLQACTGMAVLGTLQAAYTDFKYVSSTTKEIFDREALLGCSITGWMNNPEILLDEKNMQDGAKLVLKINEEVAKIIGINPTARGTTVKPEGNTSVLLETASGCHGEHDEDYFRLMQINKESEIGKILNEQYPFLIEESVWSSTKSDYVVYIPVTSKKGSIFKKDLVGIKQLEIVKKIQQNWVEYGTRVEACVKPFLRHSVSNTVEVENWDEVRDYVYENKQFYTGVSFLGKFGDKDYKQAPFTSVLTPEKILTKYGDASIFAAGLITDALYDFDDLWIATNYVVNRTTKLEGTKREVLLKKDWLRRAKQFAKRYFKNDVLQMSYCLKDVYLYHKWVEINRELKPIDFSKANLKPTYTDVDTMGSASCTGSSCEMPAEYLERFKS